MGKGRPRENNPPDPSNKGQLKRGRGRPCKSQPPINKCNTSLKPKVPDTTHTQTLESAPKRGRGRPPKRASTDTSKQPPKTHTFQT